MASANDLILNAIGPSTGAQRMAIFKFPWHDKRGAAPAGYVKGMALCYARMLCKRQSNDPVAVAIDRPTEGENDEDALVWFHEELRAAAPAVEGEEYPQLIRSFIVLFGLGMQENSGQYFAGHDTKADIWPPTADSAEAGAFQASWALASAIDTRLLDALLLPFLPETPGPNREDCFVDVFKEGAGKPSATDPQNIGAGPGFNYQVRAKSCPAYATGFAALGLRAKRSHWGTLSNHSKVQIQPEVTELFRKVQETVAIKGITKV